MLSRQIQEPTIICMGSIPAAPFTGRATRAVLEIHPPNATLIKTAIATKANFRMRAPVPFRVEPVGCGFERGSYYPGRHAADVMAITKRTIVPEGHG